MTAHKPGDPTTLNRLYGRAKGKALRKGQAERLETALPSLSLDLSAPAPADIATLFPHAPGEIRLEIGFGGGEHMIFRASETPEAGFIGVEPFINGMTKALGAIARGGLTNIRLSGEDAVKVLDWLPDACLDRVALLYPDPWPKKRHWKRRFVSTANLDRIARVLRPGGEFRFASDWSPYVDWTLKRVLEHPAFEWTARVADDWKRPWAGWPGTRYEEKAIREGRTPAYLVFRRV